MREDWQVKYKALCRKLEDMTPGGSEFVNDPEFCLDYLRRARQADSDLIKKLISRRNRFLARSWLLRLLWERQSRKESRRA